MDEIVQLTQELSRLQVEQNNITLQQNNILSRIRQIAEQNTHDNTRLLEPEVKTSEPSIILIPTRDSPIQVGDRVQFPATNITAGGEGTVVRLTRGNPPNLLINRLSSTGVGRGTIGESVTISIQKCNKL